MVNINTDIQVKPTPEHHLSPLSSKLHFAYLGRLLPEVDCTSRSIQRRSFNRQFFPQGSITYSCTRNLSKGIAKGLFEDVDRPLKLMNSLEISFRSIMWICTYCYSPPE